MHSIRTSRDKGTCAKLCQEKGNVCRPSYSSSSRYIMMALPKELERGNGADAGDVYGVRGRDVPAQRGGAGENKGISRRC